MTAQTLDETCEDDGLLKRNPQFADAYTIEAAKVGALTPTGEWHRVRDLGLAWKSAQAVWRQSVFAEPKNRDSLVWFEWSVASKSLWRARESAHTAYNDACDAYFLGDAK